MLQPAALTNFYPRPPRGGRPPLTDVRVTSVEFLSTPSARRATCEEQDHPRDTQISIHALREEGDADRARLRPQPDYFYPRPPRGGRLFKVMGREFDDLFLSTPSARRATRAVDVHDAHAVISIHALREEGDAGMIAALFASSEFLSTPSARRATRTAVAQFICVLISIHALREEGDQSGAVTIAAVAGFLSTPSARRATLWFVFLDDDFRFLSTPSARRATSVALLSLSLYVEFLSTPSARRATHHADVPTVKLHKFLSTPSARRATLVQCRFHCGKKFLSTPSARRATTEQLRQLLDVHNFYPRPPRGGRRQPHHRRDDRRRISIHALREEGDLCFHRIGKGISISIHALREEGDVRTGGRTGLYHYFYPRPPRGGRQQKQRQNLYFQTNYTTFCTNLEEP